MPPFISLARGPTGDGVGPIQGSGGGTWGQGYNPFLIGCSETGALSIPSLRLAEGITPARLADRRAMLQALDRARRALDTQADAGALRTWDDLHQKAYALLSSPAREKLQRSSRTGETLRVSV